MAVDMFGIPMARKAEPSPESIAAAEESAAAWAIHKRAGVSYLPVRSGRVGTVASSLEPEPAAHGSREAIDAHWRELGAENGPLGQPISDLTRAGDGGVAVAYEYGFIYWWPDVGAVNVERVEIRYRGMNCFSRTSRASGSDEPYFIIGSIGESGSGTGSPVHYDDVDGGGSFPFPVFTVYAGNPGSALVIPVVLMEHDLGDPTQAHSLVATAIGGAAGTIALALAIFASAGAAAVGGAAIATAVPLLVTAIDEALGAEDDYVGEASLIISAKALVTAFRTPLSRERDIDYHVATDLIAGDGAGYKAYFEFISYGWEPA